MIKVIKLKKKDYSDLEGLLERAGLVDKESGLAFPERILISKEDSKKFQKEILRAFKKKNPYIATQRLKASAGMYFLNLGPSELAGNGIRPGYAVVLSASRE